MSDDDIDIDPEPDAPVALDRKVLLLALAGAAALALTLALIRARMARPSPSLGQVDLGPNANWQVSVEHLANAFDLRLAGIDARLDQLAGEHVAATAAYSAPPSPLNGDEPMVERVPPVVVVGAEEPPPPRPAATSLPDES